MYIHYVYVYVEVVELLESRGAYEYLIYEFATC